MTKTIGLFLLVCLYFISGCGITKPFDWAAYFKECVKAFTVATDTFADGDYLSAKDLLISYQQLDSASYDYESYALLAECYNQLGMKDSGKIVYENFIMNLKDSINNNPQSSDNDILALEDMEKWASAYPVFPEELKKENGFVPYDDLPDPVNGIRGIKKVIVYPDVSPENRSTVRYMF